MKTASSSTLSLLQEVPALGQQWGQCYSQGRGVTKIVNKHLNERNFKLNLSRHPRESGMVWWLTLISLAFGRLKQEDC